MEKINTKRLKASLTSSDYDKIFKALDIPIYTRGIKYDTLYTGCHHKHATDGSPKLLFYHDIGIFQCLTQCSASFDIIGLVQRRLNVLGQSASFIDSIQFILDTTGRSIDDVKRVSKPNVINWQDGLEKFIRFRQGETSLPIYSKEILYQLSNKLPKEWIDEGISRETMKKYHIGYYDYGQCTTIPCFDKDGNLCGIRVRHWRPEEIENGKYRPLMLLDGTMYNFPTNDVFYGMNFNWAEIERTGIVTLVEGEKSVLKADSWYGEHSNVLALYGSQLGIKRRNQLLKMGFKEVNLALDSDYHKIGDEDYFKFEDKMKRLYKMFSGFADVYVIYNNLGLDGYKCSPFDFDKSTYEKLYENRGQFKL